MRALAYAAAFALLAAFPSGAIARSDTANTHAVPVCPGPANPGSAQVLAQARQPAIVS